MSVPAALTAIVIILGILTLVVLGVLILVAVLVIRLLRVERQVAAEVTRMRDAVKATVAKVGMRAERLSSTVDGWGAGARYAGLAAEAASAFLAWRRGTRPAPEPPPRKRPSRAKWIGWAIPTGILAWEMLKRMGRPTAKGPGQTS